MCVVQRSSAGQSNRLRAEPGQRRGTESCSQILSGGHTTTQLYYDMYSLILESLVKEISTVLFSVCSTQSILSFISVFSDYLSEGKPCYWFPCFLDETGTWPKQTRKTSFTLCIQSRADLNALKASVDAMIIKYNKEEGELASAVQQKRLIRSEKQSSLMAFA